MIATTTRDPQLGKYGASFIGTYGSYDLRDAQIAINIPILSSLAIRVAGHEADQNGYLSQLAGASQTREGRVKLLYRPNEAFHILLGAAGISNTTESGGPGFTLTAPEQITSAGWTSISAAHNFSRQYWAKADWDLGLGTLTYIPAYRAYFLAANVSDVGPPGHPVGIGPSATPLDQYVTQELRIASDEGSPVSWVGGAFYYNQKYKNFTGLNWINSGALAFDQSMRELSQDTGIFADAIYPVTSKLRIAAGLRWDRSDVESSELYLNNSNRSCGDGATGPACSPSEATFGLPEQLSATGLSRSEGTRHWTNWTYRARAETDITPVNLAYVSVSSGFVPGDVRVGGNANTGVFYPTPYAEETLTAIEVGSKNRFLDNKLQVNLSAYYNIFSGYQVNVQLTPTTPGSPTQVMSVPARMAGVDLEAIYRLSPADRINMTFGEIDARYVNRPTYDIGGVAYPLATYITQKRIPGIAPTTLSAGYDHQFNFADGSSVDAQATMTWSSGFYEVGYNTAYPASVTLADLYQNPEVLGTVAVTWRSANGKYSVGGYIRNIANSVYVTGLSPQFNGVVGASPTIGRSFGVQLHAAY